MIEISLAKPDLRKHFVKSDLISGMIVITNNKTKRVLINKKTFIGLSKKPTEDLDINMYDDNLNCNDINETICKVYSEPYLQGGFWFNKHIQEGDDWFKMFNLIWERKM